MPQEQISEVLDAATPVHETSVPQPEQYDDYAKTYGAESWIYVCVNRRSNALAALPLKLYYKDADGTRSEIYDHPKLDLWVNRPNPFMTKYLFWKTNISYWLLHGNAYIERVFNDSGEQVAGYPLNPTCMTIVPDPKRYISHYKFQSPLIGTKEKNLSIDQVKHVRAFSPSNDYYGQSPTSAATVAATLDLYAQAHSQNFFKQGMRPSVILTTEQKLDDSDVRRIKLQIRSMYQGVKRAWLPIVAHNGLRAFEFSQSNKDGEFVNVRKLSREEMAAVYEVPPALAGIYEYANYANAYAQKELFYRETVRVDAQAWEDELDLELYDENKALTRGKSGVSDGLIYTINSGDRVKPKPGGKLYFEFNFNDVLKVDPKERSKMYKDAIESGWMTQNDVRALENQDPVPWGDEWYLPLNKIPVSVFADDNLPDKEKLRRLTEYIGAADKMRKILNDAAEQAVPDEIDRVDGDDDDDAAAGDDDDAATDDDDNDDNDDNDDGGAGKAAAEHRGNDDHGKK